MAISRVQSLQFVKTFSWLRYPYFYTVVNLSQVSLKFNRTFIKLKHICDIFILMAERQLFFNNNNNKAIAAWRNPFLNIAHRFDHLHWLCIALNCIEFHWMIQFESITLSNLLNCVLEKRINHEFVYHLVISTPMIASRHLNNSHIKQKVVNQLAVEENE